MSVGLILVLCAPVKAAFAQFIGTRMTLYEHYLRRMGEDMREGPGFLESVINYASMRVVTEQLPATLRSRLAACGTCKDRGFLQQQLAEAERDKAIVEKLETAVVEAYGIDQWTAWKMGVKSRPPAVRKEPHFCILLYDRAYDCAVKNDNKYAGNFGGACHTEQRLHNLCVAGNAKAFYEYLQFVQRKERGELIFEHDSNQVTHKVHYYNALPNVAFPIETPQPEKYYHLSTDRVALGSVKSLSVMGMSGIGPGIRYSNPEEFREPWRTILREDIAAVASDARLLYCRYVIENVNRVQSFSFWYARVPAAADPARLDSRMANHPLLRVGAPRTTCPVTLAEAYTLVPFLTDQQVAAQLGESLRKPGDPPERTSPQLGAPEPMQSAEERARIRESRRTPPPTPTQRRRPPRDTLPSNAGSR